MELGGGAAAHLDWKSAETNTSRWVAGSAPVGSADRIYAYSSPAAAIEDMLLVL
jgi:hypothetical protein